MWSNLDDKWMSRAAAFITDWSRRSRCSGMPTSVVGIPLHCMVLSCFHYSPIEPLLYYFPCHLPNVFQFVQLIFMGWYEYTLLIIYGVYFWGV